MSGNDEAYYSLTLVRQLCQLELRGAHENDHASKTCYQEQPLRML